jgi:HK97 family phage major capsid protein
MADISRAEALALINQQNSTEIFQQAAEGSAALRTFRRVNLGTKQARLPVLSALPSAGFVESEDPSSGDSTKPTSQAAWENKVLEAEEIAVIVPIHENVFDDSAFDIWGEVRPRIAEALGAVLDGAVFFSTAKPSTWPEGLEQGARDAGNIFDNGTANMDLAELTNQTIALVEADGYDPNVAFSNRAIRVRFRGLRDDQGQPIYSTSLRRDGAVDAVYGLDLEFVTNGAWIADNGSGLGADLIVGDRSKAILGVRQDVTYKFLDQATVGGINLAEKDMVALRAKFRVGFQVADATTIEGGSSAYPFAVLTSPST